MECVISNRSVAVPHCPLALSELLCNLIQGLSTVGRLGGTPAATRESALLLLATASAIDSVMSLETAVTT